MTRGRGWACATGAVLARSAGPAYDFIVVPPESQLHQARLIRITPLPQHVPSQVCQSCDVCCHFPEPDSALRPYFTEAEIRRAIAAGIDPGHFSDSTGCQVTPTTHPVGDGYLCPAFDPTTSRCRIYEARPLDCQLYPLAMMWNAEHNRVVLGWDSKCPFLRERGGGASLPPGVTPEVEVYAERMAEMLERTELLEVLARHPRLIGPFQEDVVILKPLELVTERLAVNGVRPACPLTVDDRPRFERRLSRIETPLAAYAFSPHFIWRGLFSYCWTEIAGHLCLVAEQGGGIFMPLPPLAPERPTGPDPRAFRESWAMMPTWNRGSSISRIENVPEEWKEALEALGYRVSPKDPDYLYRTSELARLAGDPYRSQRAACNRFLRTHRARYEPYDDEAHREGCLALYHRWAGQQRARGLDSVAGQMLTDSESAHHETLTHARALGLVGRVVWVDGAIGAYTFGYERSPSVCCVLLEVADRRITGLAQFVFREFCREASDRGYAYVNTMDDSGLPALARAKQSYHPCRVIPSFIVTEP